MMSPELDYIRKTRRCVGPTQSVGVEGGDTICRHAERGELPPTSALVDS